MIALVPPLMFVLAWVFALIGWNAPGADAATPFDEQALRWILFLAVGWAGVGGSIPHTIFARQTAKSIGWETNGFQYEVGFANLAVGLGGIYAPSRTPPRGGSPRRSSAASSWRSRASTTSSRSSETATTRRATRRS